MYWLILALFILIIIYLYFQNSTISKSFYKIHISTMHPASAGKKVIFLSDTHFRERSGDKLGIELIKKIEEEAPDVILFGGDIVHASASDRVVEYIKDFFFLLGKVAPTYVVYGNHDLGHPRVKELTATLKIAGVTLMENDSKWISLGGRGIGFWLMGLTESRIYLDSKHEVMSKIGIPDRSQGQPKILLTHYPEYFEKYLKKDKVRPDLVLSGHTHGGQVRLPLVGGLFAPGQGVNPTYDYGLFNSKTYPDSRLVISRGIGSSSFPFRINNRPDLVVIEFY